MLFDDTYFSIQQNSEGLFKDKGSKFIAFAYPVKTEKEIKEIIAALKKEHHSARHHCYAYRLGADKQTYRSNDDGEPSNTAGKPILGQIRSKDLTNILIVVVRYFGGTLLGVSGLINAYKLAAADTLSNAVIVEHHILFEYKITFGFEQMNEVMKLMKDNNAKITEQQFDNNCSLTFHLQKNAAEKTEQQLSQIKGIKLNFITTI